MATPRNDMVEVATARANVYGLLADVFREEPSEALLSKLGGRNSPAPCMHSIFPWMRCSRAPRARNLLRTWPLNSLGCS